MKSRRIALLPKNNGETTKVRELRALRDDAPEKLQKRRYGPKARLTRTRQMGFAHFPQEAYNKKASTRASKTEPI